MDATPLLALPLLAAAQAQKHITHNEALGALDTLVQLAVRDKDRTAPPADPAEGDRYLIASAAPSGAWAGWAGRVVRFEDGAWRSFVARPGWLAYVADEAALYAYDGAAWRRPGVVTVAARINFDAYLSADAWTRVPFNEAASNDQGAFDAGANSITVPLAGAYAVQAGLTYRRNGTSAPSALELRFERNGAAAGAGRAAATGTLVSEVTALGLSAVLVLAAGDVVTVAARFTGADGYLAAADSGWGLHRLP
ncbi:DUF2793 domain-containing protein [Methylobacterium oryzihabitans]|uniref:DUF2793 domain-containing protein n=1 Tax=Methylobacterium oryzihabitans TaxID=2499852 RepID=A0A437P5G5_9HYPH|nr:DUF2793 domain-containing protein [Methylobacterium oryzihabitans]RVU17510.1 DUF2793 domain-containing protein [Methylobacterium oryzihabitans]